MSTLISVIAGVYLIVYSFRVAFSYESQAAVPKEERVIYFGAAGLLPIGAVLILNPIIDLF